MSRVVTRTILGALLLCAAAATATAQPAAQRLVVFEGFYRPT